MNKFFFISILCTTVYSYSAEHPKRFDTGSPQRAAGLNNSRVKVGIALTRKKDLGDTGAAVRVPVSNSLMPTIPELPEPTKKITPPLFKKTSPTVQRVMNHDKLTLTEDMKLVRQKAIASSMVVQSSTFHQEK